MAEFFDYEAILDNGTFKLDATTTAALNKPTELNGKVVTLTDNYTVGFGSAGDRPLGVVLMTEPVQNGSEELCCSVRFNRSKQDIPCAGTETAGAYAACDGKGGIQASTDPTNAVVYGVDAEAKTCTVYIHG